MMAIGKQKKVNALPERIRKSAVLNFEQLQQLGTVDHNVSHYNDRALLSLLFELRQENGTLEYDVHEQAARLIGEGCITEAWELLHAEMDFHQKINTI